MTNKKKLTIGMAVFDDFDGVYFTIQSLRLYHQNICNKDNTEFLIIDNNPDSPQGKETKKYIESMGERYIAYTNKQSTTVRNEIFKNSNGEYTLCMDCHVFIHPTGLDYLLKYYNENPNTKNLITGPLLYDDLVNVSTHFNKIWIGSMYGQWGFDNRYNNNEPFEIDMQGCGLFSCKTEHWVGFNDNFIGFGGEEGYIHEKFRLVNNAKVMCIPQLKWMHRFYRPKGVPYRLVLEDRVFNYFLGWLELYKDENHIIISQIKDHFKDKINEDRMISLFESAKKLNHL